MIKKIIFILLFINLSCSYHFSNNLTDDHNFSLIRIHVKPLTDHSKKVIPHDHLWEKLQEVLISTGKIKLVSSQEDSDYFLNLDLLEVVLTPKSFQGRGESHLNKNFQVSLKAKNPSSLKSYSSNLSSRDFAISRNLGIKLKIQMFDSHSYKKLSSESYLVSGESLLYDSHDNLKVHFIRSEENVSFVLGRLGKQIAQDFYRNLKRTLSKSNI